MTTNNLTYNQILENYRETNDKKLLMILINKIRPAIQRRINSILDRYNVNKNHFDAEEFEQEMIANILDAVHSYRYKLSKSDPGFYTKQEFDNFIKDKFLSSKPYCSFTTYLFRYLGIFSMRYISKWYLTKKSEVYYEESIIDLFVIAEQKILANDSRRIIKEKIEDTFSDGYMYETEKSELTKEQNDKLKISQSNEIKERRILKYKDELKRIREKQEKTRLENKKESEKNNKKPIRIKIDNIVKNAAKQVEKNKLIESAKTFSKKINCCFNSTLNEIKTNLSCAKNKISNSLDETINICLDLMENNYNRDTIIKILKTYGCTNYLIYKAFNFVKKYLYGDLQYNNRYCESR